MRRFRFKLTRNTLAAIILAGGMIVTAAAPAAAAPWQNTQGDYDSQQKWHDANWWIQSQPDGVIVLHSEWTENYSETHSSIGNPDRFHAWHYGDGGFDRRSIAIPMRAAKNEAETVPCCIIEPRAIGQNRANERISMK